MTKFNTVAEAYGFWKRSTPAVMEARAEAIASDVKGNAEADVAAYNIELEGIEQALAEKRAEQPPAEKRAAAPEAVMATAGADPVEDPAASKIYRSAFYKHLQGKELTAQEKAAFDEVNGEKRAAAFNTLSNAAAVIPTQTLNEVVSKAREMGGILSVSRAFSMPTGISVPVATPGGAASWHTEGAAVDSEKADVSPVVFSAYEILRILSISAATKTMSVAAFEGYLAEELTASVFACLGKAMVDGTGSGQGEGIVSGITWTDNVNKVTVAKTANLTYANILSAIAMLKRGYAANAKFAMNNATLYQDVYGLTDSNGRPLFVADPVEKGKGRILGFEVVVDDFMADHDILFGDFRYNGYNLPSGIALDVSRESSFAKGLVDYRALAIADCKPIVDEAFVYITKATA